MSLLTLRQLACGYTEHPVVSGLDLTLEPGEIGCLLGPSGCGKTTTLRAIAGFEPISQGEIKLAGEILSRPGFTVAPEKRHIGMVFQDYALFPHLTVAENVAFGIRRHPERTRVVNELTRLVKLDALHTRYPHELSGGQQQRVALARALAPSPRLLLLDEPFSNLDVELRRTLSAEVRDILKSRGTSAVLVTHDQEEAFAVSDKIGVFQHGHLEQWDTPGRLYHAPETPFVATFIGQGYFIPGIGMGNNTIRTELGIVESLNLKVSEGQLVNVLIRPDFLIRSPESPVQGRVVTHTFLGASSRYHLQLPSGTLVEATFPGLVEQQTGEMIGIRLRETVVTVFKAE
ncbi:iron(III) transport system ATP-binding protein [Pseudomonas duriflava]|uniref:Iron(III) transport system ATP-binding protein n=1 Tax=Pseudomonas duriflava TaxID=459528 RepID=A0A562QG25_9PSED|nr:ABC transporter ATP-binding protein [Pseudomonas duriflava]TWI55691.1 iron(III) transport system ATP-binding protein [Pseudomonas duriflava]